MVRRELSSSDCGPVRTLCWNIPDIKSFLLLVGTLPGFVIKLISEGNANFEGCDGPIYLPTDLSSIKDIKKIDLHSLGGRLQGVFTGAIIRMISDMRAKHGTDSVNLYNCGKFTLAEDLSDIKDIKSIDLSSISSLEGT